MLTNFFDNTRPITILVLFIALAVISLTGVYIYFNDIDFQSTYLINSQFDFLGNIPKAILSVLLVLSLGFIVNFIVHDNSITRKNSYALLFFVVLIASDPSLTILNPVLASVFFVVLALKNLLSLHEHKDMTQKLFNTGLLLGIASVIYPYAILYALLIFLGIVIYGVDSWRHWFIPILGIVLPFYILFSWYFWFDDLNYYWNTFFIKTLYITQSDFHKSLETIIVWGIFALLTIFSVLDYSKNMSFHKPDTRKGYTMTYLALFVGIIILAVGSINNGQELIILFFPISIIWAKFIQHQKKELYKTIFIAIVVLNSLFSLIMDFY